MIRVVLELPPLAETQSGAGPLLQCAAGLGAVCYAVAAIPYAVGYHRSLTLLPTSVVARFVQLAEALFGSALSREWTTSCEASPKVIQRPPSEMPPEVRAVLQEQGPAAFSAHSDSPLRDHQPTSQRRGNAQSEDHRSSFAQIDAHQPRR
jgi:hypothetical protein